MDEERARAPSTARSGAYDPVISDGKHLYLTAHHTLTALRPRKHHRR